MSKVLSKILNLVAASAVAGAISLTGIGMSAQSAAAQNWDPNTRSQQGRDQGRYVPTIWVDPDGCEHWVMDDGAEGYMTPHTNRQGIPVCRRGQMCGVMNSDQFFATDSARISKHGQQRLAEFFQQRCL